MRRVIAGLYDLLVSLDTRIAFFDNEIQLVFTQSEDCQRISKIKGVGPRTTTAVIAAIGQGKEFKNGRHFAAWLGLVPRQHSSGDRQVMMNITKRGDQHLRTLLSHGARAVVRTAQNKPDHSSCWIQQLKDRRGYDKAALAVANKNARIIWAVLRHGQEYRGITV